MTVVRKSLAEITNNKLPAPNQLDCIEFEYENVQFRVYGILHCITGGLNHEYRQFIKRSIKQVHGPKLAEKGMKQLYSGCGIDQELDDWMVLRWIDCLVMGFQLIVDPGCLRMITLDALTEKFRQKDPFPESQKRIDLGESPYFHYLDEHQRREMVGFMPSNEAITNDLKSLSRFWKAILPTKRARDIEHPQWARILLLERVMHIPARSIHMLHYALGYAKHHNHKMVNVFVGETHNTDMHYLATNEDDFTSSLPDELRSMHKKISSRAFKAGENKRLPGKLKLAWKKVNYLGSLMLGAGVAISIPFLLYHFARFG